MSATKMSSPSVFAASEDEIRRVAYETGCGVFDVVNVTKDFASFEWMEMLLYAAVKKKWRMFILILPIFSHGLKQN